MRLDPAAQARAKLILMEGGNLRGIEVVSGVQVGVAEELESVAVEIVSARFGHQVDRRAAGAPGGGVAVRWFAS